MDYLYAAIEELLTNLKQEEKKYADIVASSPPGRVYCHRRGKTCTFVHAVKADDYREKVKKKEEYVKSGTNLYRRGITKNKGLLKAMAQKEYAENVLKAIRRNIWVLKSAKGKLEDLSPEMICDTMRRAYKLIPKEYVSELFLPGNTTKVYEEWAQRIYPQSDFKTEQKTLRTTRGLLVRTKAELIIAERLYYFGIPFRYEQVLVFGKYELVPDFTFPSAKREEFYLEYCGLMDDPDYVNRFLWKRRIYEANGINEWDGKIIYIFDKNNEMDMEEIDRVIQNKIIPRL